MRFDKWTDTVAFSYRRFSDPPQKEGRSTKRQEGTYAGWFSRHPGVVLDRRLRMNDDGVSGLSGEHRRNPKYALGAFLERVEDGTVLPGSYLLVENIDRLTREHPRDSMFWILRLIHAGIRIVSLSPVETQYDLNAGARELQSLLSELDRAHQESLRKIDTVGDAWRDKKAEARNGKPIGRAVPCWIELVDGAYRLKVGVAEAFARLAELSIAGMGHLTLAARLNAESVPCPAPSGRWSRSFVSRVLASRAVLGEYQPCTGHRHREVDGAPIPGYFPPALSATQWHQARQAVAARDGSTGRPARSGAPTSPFAGLLWDAVHDCRLRHCRKRVGAYFLPARAKEGEPGIRGLLFPVPVLVDGLLSRLRELRADDLFADPSAGQLAVIDSRLADARKRLAVARERFRSDPDSDVWADEVSRLDKQIRELVGERERVVAEVSHPLSGQWRAVVKQIAENDPRRLRQALLNCVQSVRCVFFSRSPYRAVAAQVWFQGGETNRAYVIAYKSAGKGEVGKRRPPPVVFSPDALGAPRLDLRDAGQARAMLKVLAAEDWARRVGG